MSDDAIFSVLLGFGGVALVTAGAVVWPHIERARERAPHPWDRF